MQSIVGFLQHSETTDSVKRYAAQICYRTKCNVLDINVVGGLFLICFLLKYLFVCRLSSCGSITWPSTTRRWATPIRPCSQCCRTSKSWSAKWEMAHVLSKTFNEQCLLLSNLLFLHYRNRWTAQESNGVIKIITSLFSEIILKAYSDNLPITDLSLNLQVNLNSPWWLEVIQMSTRCSTDEDLVSRVKNELTSSYKQQANKLSMADK